MSRFRRGIQALVAFWVLSLGQIALAGNGREELVLQKVVESLRVLPSGAALLKRAKLAWNTKTDQELLKHLKWGSVSKTDAVLIRHYDPSTGEESREREVTIVLRREQAETGVILDLAHELVHATSKPEWDPYDANLTPGRYIQAAIDGAGGEVQAVLLECKVGLELSHGDVNHLAFGRCKKYFTKHISTARVRRDFYRVGPWAEQLKEDLGDEKKLFPLLSNEPVALYSSTGGTPYPVALFEEYRQMTAVACQNSKKRLEESSAPLREPAAEPSNARPAALFQSRRCHP